MTSRQEANNGSPSHSLPWWHQKGLIHLNPQEKCALKVSCRFTGLQALEGKTSFWLSACVQSASATTVQETTEHDEESLWDVFDSRVGEPTMDRVSQIMLLLRFNTVSKPYIYQEEMTVWITGPTCHHIPPSIPAGQSFQSNHISLPRENISQSRRDLVQKKNCLSNVEHVVFLNKNN